MRYDKQWDSVPTRNYGTGVRISLLSCDLQRWRISPIDRFVSQEALDIVNAIHVFPTIEPSVIIVFVIRLVMVKERVRTTKPTTSVASACSSSTGGGAVGGPFPG